MQKQTKMDESGGGVASAVGVSIAKPKTYVQHISIYLRHSMGVIIEYIIDRRCFPQGRALSRVIVTTVFCRAATEQYRRYRTISSLPNNIVDTDQYRRCVAYYHERAP